MVRELAHGREVLIAFRGSGITVSACPSRRHNVYLGATDCTPSKHLRRERRETASRSIETSTEPREFVAQGDRVLVVGFASGTIKATNKTFEDDWIFAITVQDGKLTSIREYIDTQALARASLMDASGLP